TFTLMNRNAAQKIVNVTTSTAYFARGISSPTFANVCVDEMVGATGTRDNGVITATDVMIWSPVPDDFSAFGMVLSVNGSTAAGACGTSGGTGTFTIIKRNASRTIVDVTSNTKFRPKGQSFANVCVNGMVGAAGNVSGTDLVADVVRIHAAPGSA